MLHLFEELVYARGVFFGIVQCEMELGDSAKLQALKNFVADETRSVFQSLDGVFLFRFRTTGADEDPRIASVIGEADVVDDNGDFQPRVAKFTGEHGVDLVSDLFSDAFTAMADGGHGPPIECEIILYSIAPAGTSGGDTGLQDVNGVINEDRPEDALRFFKNVLQGFLNVLFGVGKRDHADGGGLPNVVEVEFCNGDIELAPQTIFEATNDLPLVLEGAGVRNLQLENQQSNGHRKRRLKLLASGGAGLCSGFRAGKFHNAEGFEMVANLDVVEIGDACAAFEAGADFTGVVLEALERAEL